MKKLIRIISVMLAVVIFACSSLNVFAAGGGPGGQGGQGGQGNGQGNQSGIDRARNGVVFITSDGGSGSGFAIGEDLNAPVRYIVTNAHVAGDTNTNTRYDTVIVWFSVMANDFMIAEIYAIDFSRDLCILRLPEETTKRNALAINTTVLGSGASIYAMGYPDYAMGQGGYSSMSTNDLVVTDGIISQQLRMIENNLGFEAYMHSATTSFGNSGGPVVNANGEVVGVSTWITNVEGAAARSSICTIADELALVLDSNRVKYVDASKQQQEQRSPILIIVIIAAAVLIIAAVIIFIVVKKKKSSPKAAPVQYQQQMSTPSAPSRGNAVITGMKGTMAGQTFSINGNILIGRNAQKCNVAYPVDTKGISAVHCQIRQTSNGFEIVDRGSSNGTFLGSGQRLTPNVPTYLPDGTFFYLGSAEQLFQIKY